MSFNADEPRDEHGKWTSAGEALGSALNDPSLASFKQAVDRGAWNIGVSNVRDTYGEKVTTFAIMPKGIPAGWKVYEDDGAHDQRRTFYDPNYAHVEVMTPYHSVVVPNNRDQGDFPEKAQPGILYRGMTNEEYQSALKTGSLKSLGDYNLGEREKGLTYYSTDPDQAVAYANGFAPWPYKPTPNQPAIVVAIKDNPAQERDVRNTEVGLRGEVPISAIQRVYVGKPTYVQSGYTDVVQSRGRQAYTGSGSSVSTGVRWELEGSGAPTDKVDIRRDMTWAGSHDQSQPVKDMDELYRKSKDEEDAFRAMVEKQAEQSGVGTKFPPTKSSEPGTLGMKTKARAERKAREDYGGDVTKIRDVLRASFIGDSVVKTRNAAADFITAHRDSVIRIKDRFTNPSLGYRDILVNYRTPSGLIAEVQFGSKSILAAKSGEGHKVYAEIQALQNGHFDDRASADKALTDLEKKETHLYETAYNADGDGHGWQH